MGDESSFCQERQGTFDFCCGCVQSGQLFHPPARMIDSPRFDCKNALANFLLHFLAISLLFPAYFLADARN